MVSVARISNPLANLPILGYTPPSDVDESDATSLEEGGDEGRVDLGARAGADLVAETKVGGLREDEEDRCCREEGCSNAGSVSERFG